MYPPKSSSWFFLFLFAFSFLIISPTQAQEKERYESVKDALQSSGKLSGASGPSNINWIDDGDRYSYMQYNAEAKANEIRAYKPDTGDDVLIFRNKDYTFPDSDSTFAYRSFQWSRDSKYIVFQSNFRPVYRRSGIADYYLYSIEGDTLSLLAEDARTAELSPDGQKIGYERDGDLFVYDIATGQETQLTNSGKEFFYNGRFGWVYEEEFGLAQAWTWSPDSKHIAYWQTDERDVHIFQMTDYSGHHNEYQKIPYPQVGDKNPDIKIGVVNVENGVKNWMDLPIGDGYVPRLYWTSDPGKLAIVHLNRPQTELKLFFSDINSGESEVVMQEQSDEWIDVFDFFAGINHLFFFPKDREEFFWISDRDGWSHIYRFNYDGELLNQVTEGNWEVTYVHTVDYDNGRIYFNSTEESPLERHLYSIKFDGSNKTKITDTDGDHNITMGPNAKFYLDRYSNVNTPTQVELRQRNGQLIKTLEDNTEVTEYINKHVYSPKELFSFETSDGQKLDGYIIKPIDFDSTKSYPLVMNIYGGPGAQGVYNSFATSTWEQYLAQKGFVVANVNNRGSGGYGSEFEKIVYKQLGKWEANDFAETAKYLGNKAWVDSSRMAIRGHSYGGYMTTYALGTHPDVFEVGISTAPVTSWDLYDSIYAERYMGLWENNKEGYEQSSSTTHAGNIKGHLLLSHSTLDENVHVQNTMQFITAMASMGKDIDLRIYPPGAHGVAFNQSSYYLLYETYTDYLMKHLK